MGRHVQAGRRGPVRHRPHAPSSSSASGATTIRTIPAAWTTCARGGGRRRHQLRCRPRDPDATQPRVTVRPKPSLLLGATPAGDPLPRSGGRVGQPPPGPDRRSREAAGPLHEPSFRAPSSAPTERPLAVLLSFLRPAFRPSFGSPRVRLAAFRLRSGLLHPELSTHFASRPPGQALCAKSRSFCTRNPTPSPDRDADIPNSSPTVPSCPQARRHPYPRPRPGTGVALPPTAQWRAADTPGEVIDQGTPHDRQRRGPPSVAKTPAVPATAARPLRPADRRRMRRGVRAGAVAVAPSGGPRALAVAPDRPWRPGRPTSRGPPLAADPHATEQPRPAAPAWIMRLGPRRARPLPARVDGRLPVHERGPSLPDNHVPVRSADGLGRWGPVTAAHATRRVGRSRGSPGPHVHRFGTPTSSTSRPGGRIRAVHGVHRRALGRPPLGPSCRRSRSRSSARRPTGLDRPPHLRGHGGTLLDVLEVRRQRQRPVHPGDRTSMSQRLSADGQELSAAEPSSWPRSIRGRGPSSEAPDMVEVDGRYWLFYSGNWFNQPAYAIGVARLRRAARPVPRRRARPLVGLRHPGRRARARSPRSPTAPGRLAAVLPVPLDVPDPPPPRSVAAWSASGSWPRGPDVAAARPGAPGGRAAPRPSPHRGRDVGGADTAVDHERGRGDERGVVDARKAAAAAISSGLPNRPMGTCTSRRAARSGSWANSSRNSGVLTGPGTAC